MWVIQTIRDFFAYCVILLGTGVMTLGFMFLSRDEKVKFSRTALQSINQVVRKYNL